MIEPAIAVEFIRRAESGRTGPLLMVIEDACGRNLEAFCKISSACEQGVVNLVREVIAACLAGDLGLPIPKPYIVEIPPELNDALGDSEAARAIQTSSGYSFGSTRAPNQFALWLPGDQVPSGLTQTAAETLVFDAIIQNPDRRSENPNCLKRGEEIRVIDHELAFATNLLIGWQPPWELGSLRNLERPGAHIFRSALIGRDMDFAAIRSAWLDLSDDRLAEYISTIPLEWEDAADDARRAVDLIRGARDNIDLCLEEVRRILS